MPENPKVYSDAKAALAGLTFDDMTVMSGGFGLCGIPENLIKALRDEGKDGAGHRSLHFGNVVPANEHTLDRHGPADAGEGVDAIAQFLDGRHDLSLSLLGEG